MGRVVTTRASKPSKRCAQGVQPSGDRHGGQWIHGVPFKQLGDGIDGQFVAQPAEAGDHAGGHRGQHRGVAERLAPGRVREVELDGRAVEGGHGVVERPGGVAERPGVDDECGGAAPGGVDGLDQFALVVGLEVLERQAVARRLWLSARATWSARVAVP